MVEFKGRFTPKQESIGQISISEIIDRCNDATAKMSAKNPHRFLIFLCANALRQLVDRIDKYERENQVRIH